MSSPGTPLPSASFPLPPPVARLPIGEVRGNGQVYFNQVGLEFITKLWAGIQGNGGLVPQLSAIIDQFLEVPLPAGAALSAHRVVTIAGGSLAYPSIDTLNDGLGVIGITMAAATKAGDSVRIQTFGTMTEPSWAWTPGAPVYCVDQGVLSQTAPGDGGDWVLQVGVAVTATEIMVGLRQLTLLA